MPTTRKLVRVFLASPGDLADERRAAKEVVDEFNARWADEFGYQIELVGWEDTVSTFQRPQAAINRELESCELFVGMMWRRWGTPPDLAGKYTSGFEEEFSLSVDRRSREGTPEISLFFKDITPDLLRDPGDDLKKVLAFQKRLIDGKQLLFEKFTDTRQFEKKFDRCIAAYVKSLRARERSAASEQAQTPTSEGASQPSPEQETPLSAEGAAFLHEFLSATEKVDGDSIQAADVARFRLLGSLVSTNENDEPTIGVHDANLLYRHRDTLRLGKREIEALLGRALEHLPSKVVPLWCWVSSLCGFAGPRLPLISVLGRSARAGALEAMALIQMPLPSNEPEKRSMFVDRWLDKSTPAAARLAALKYLAICGIEADLPAIRRELDAAEVLTVTAAAEATVSISMRQSRDKAARALNELQGISIRGELVESVYSISTAIPDETLLAASEHRNADVRRVAMRVLRKRGRLTADAAEKLLSDADCSIRYEAVRTLEEGGRAFSIEQAKAVIVKPAPSFPWGAHTGKDGEECWAEYEKERLRALPDVELEGLAASANLFDRDAYFVLAERRFARHAPGLRAAVDDGFEADWNKALEVWKQSLGEELGEKAKTVEGFSRRQFTRQALDVLCRRDDPADLPRVRSCLREGAVDYSPEDLRYLRRHGEWEDIPLIVESLGRVGAARKSLVFGLDDDERFELAAQALYHLGRERLEEIFALALPEKLTLALVRLVPIAGYRGLRDETLDQLLRSAHDSVRTAAAVKCVRAFPKAKIARLLSSYISKGQYYYNAVHWLDLGISSPREQAVIAAEAILSARGP